MAPDATTTRPPSGLLARRYAAPACTLILLAGLVTDRVLFHLPVGDPGTYHERVKAAVEAIPLLVGRWSGTESAPPRSAVELLRPNVILGRRYVHDATGLTMDLVFVHCPDARDLAGHYPPVCYPSSGWWHDKALDRTGTWTVGGLAIPHTIYEFAQSEEPGAPRIRIFHFVLRPDGRIEADMKGLREAAFDPRKKVYGGGQVQLVFAATTPASDQEAATRELLEACLPALREILAGVTE